MFHDLFIDVLVALLTALATLGARYVYKYLLPDVCRWLKTRTSADQYALAARLAATAAAFVEQVYIQMHGDEKLNAALEILRQRLAERHIVLTEDDKRELVEAAVHGFNVGRERANATP